MSISEAASMLRESKVREQLDRQGKSIEELAEIVGRLSSRVDSVLAPENPGIKDTDSHKEDVLSSLASELRMNNGKISTLAYRLNDLLSRLEL